MTPAELQEIADKALVVSRSAPKGSLVRERFSDLREAALSAQASLVVPPKPATPKPKPGPTTTGPHA